MTKSDEIIEQYKKTYLEIKGKKINIVRRGSWVYLDDESKGGYNSAHRISDIEKYTQELNAIKLKNPEAVADLIIPFVMDLIPKEPGIRELVKMIQSDGRRIFHSKNIKETQLLGKLITKRAKRIHNLLEN